MDSGYDIYWGSFFFLNKKVNEPILQLEFLKSPNMFYRVAYKRGLPHIYSGCFK